MEAEFINVTVLRLCLLEHFVRGSHALGSMLSVIQAYI